MASYKLRGVPTCTKTQKVLLYFYANNLDCEFVQVEGRHGDSVHPYDHVPALCHGDYEVQESWEIKRYLSRRHAETGWRLNYEVHEFLEMEHRFELVATSLNWELVHKRAHRVAPDSARVSRLCQELVDVLDEYESHLERSSGYLLGGGFSCADLHHIPDIHLLLETHVGQEFSRRTNVNQWVKNLTEREEWRRVKTTLRI